MKKIVVAVVSSLVTAGVLVSAGYVVQKKSTEIANDEMLKTITMAVKKRLGQTEKNIESQLAAFAAVVQNDNEFSLKLLVENDRSSPVITLMAGRFMKPMGFSALEIADSSGTILSSGQFPANAGNSCKGKGALLGTAPKLCNDNFTGEDVLTMQAKRSFAIADFKFQVMGGIAVTPQFLKDIAPIDKVTLLLKKGNTYVGMEKVTSISEIKQGSIIINDKAWQASEVVLPSADPSDTVKLLILIDK